MFQTSKDEFVYTDSKFIKVGERNGEINEKERNNREIQFNWA